MLRSTSRRGPWPGDEAQGPLLEERHPPPHPEQQEAPDDREVIEHQRAVRHPLAPGAPKKLSKVKKCKIYAFSQPAKHRSLIRTEEWAKATSETSTGRDIT